MDSDLFPLINTEELFSIELNQQSTTNPSFNYSFAAVPNLVGKSPEGSLIIGGGFNAGFFVLKPDVTMFDRIWARAMAEGHPWNYHKDMEQGLLNDFFATTGDVPMRTLHWSWNVKDMSDEFLSEAKIVHARYQFLLYL